VSEDAKLFCLVHFQYVLKLQPDNCVKLCSSSLPCCFFSTIEPNFEVLYKHFIWEYHFKFLGNTN
jgi:hypothetical protein